MKDGGLASRRSGGIRRLDHGGRRIDRSSTVARCPPSGSGTAARPPRPTDGLGLAPAVPYRGVGSLHVLSGALAALRVTRRCASPWHGCLRTAHREVLAGPRCPGADRSLSGPALLAAWAAARGSGPFGEPRDAGVRSGHRARHPGGRPLVGRWPGRHALAAGDTAPSPPSCGRRPAGLSRAAAIGVIGGRRLEADHDLSSDGPLQQLLDTRS